MNIRMAFILTLMLFASLSGVAAEEGSSALLGQGLAEKEQSYAKSIALPAFTIKNHILKQDRNQQVSAAFKNPASRKCPPFCVQPNQVPGAITVKLEDFPRFAQLMEEGRLLLVDMRTPEWFKNGTIAGSINFPYNDLIGKRTKAIARIKLLKNLDILVFCNGWWCGQSPTGIEALVRLNYPGKIYYFRGGIQDWLDGGLPLVTAEGVVKTKPCP